MTTQSLDLNLIPKGISPRLYVSQYDKGQTWTFNIYAGNTAYTIPNGATVTIQGTKPDKTGFQYSCTASGNVVTATEQQQMTVIAGEVPAEIRITNNNEIIATLNFILVVEPAALTDETEISETDLPIIEQAIEMFPHYQEMIDDVSSDIATLSNVRAELGAHNLMPNDYRIRTLQGITVSRGSDGSLGLTGTVTQDVDLVIETFTLKAGNTYIFTTDGSTDDGYSPDPTTPAANYSLYIKGINGSDAWINAKDNKSARTFTLTVDSTITLRIYVKNANTLHDLTYYPMIRLASDTDPTYQPYAKPNTELTKDDSGLNANAFANGAVNLFKPSMSSQVTNGVTYVVNDDYTISTSGTASNGTSLSIGAYVYKAGRYKVSGCPQNVDSNVRLKVVAMKDGSPTWVKIVNEVGNGCEIEIDGSTVDKINILFDIDKNANMNGKVFKPMITVADMPNSDYAHYVPYAKSNKTITDILTDLIKIVTIDDVTTSSSGNILLANYIPSGYHLVYAFVDTTSAQGVCTSSYTYYQHNPILRVLNGNGDVLANATVRIVLEFVKYNT